MKVIKPYISKFLVLTMFLIMSGIGVANAQSSFTDSTLLGNNTINIEVYPNPAQNHLKITLDEENNDLTNEDEEEYYQYSIGNVIGKKKKSGKVQKKPGSPITIDLDISNLSPGVYFIIVSRGKYSSTIRFIKK